MTYQELVKQVREYIYHTDVSDFPGHLAVQFNVYGEGEGAFYVEVKDGRIEIQPYQYFDRDALVYLDGETLLRLAAGEILFGDAYRENKIVVQGRHDAVLQFDHFLIRKSEPKRGKYMKMRRLVRKSPQGRRHQTVLVSKGS